MRFADRLAGEMSADERLDPAAAATTFCSAAHAHRISKKDIAG
jgi:hypothetical protein